jgi:hypothetical protein
MKSHWILVLFLLLTSCVSGSKARISLEEARVPVSMSRTVRDENGNLLKLGELEKVGKFNTTLLSWSILYKSVPLSGKKDISLDVNDQVSKVNGEALVNTTIECRSCGLINLPVLSVLPFWPTCSIINANADIVRRKAQKGAQ